MALNRVRQGRLLRALLGIGALSLWLTSGCATVQPWERETLGHPAMREDADPEGRSFSNHVAGAREAALDSGASGGGGCGCN